MKKIMRTLMAVVVMCLTMNVGTYAYAISDYKLFFDYVVEEKELELNRMYEEEGYNVTYDLSIEDINDEDNTCVLYARLYVCGSEWYTMCIDLDLSDLESDLDFSDNTVRISLPNDDRVFSMDEFIEYMCPEL